MTTFIDIETQTRANRPPAATLSYMRGGKKADRPSLKIVIPSSITGQTKKETTFKLQLSSGSEYSVLRVARDKDGKGVKPAHMKWATRFNFGFVPTLGEDIFDGERFPVTKVDENTFDIRLPAKFFGAADAAGGSPVVKLTAAQR